MSDLLDPLVYSGIKNNLTSQQLNDTGLTNSLTQGSNVNDILNNTTIKRACCIYKNRPNNNESTYTIPVRIPTYTKYTNNDPLININLWNKFNYIDKSVKIPKSMCDNFPGYNYIDTKCQDFMALYCNNVKAFYKKQVESLNLSPSDDEFSKYKPECACYVDQPSYITGAVPAVCFAPGCDPNSSNIFQDSNSRNKCSVTICQASFDAKDVSVGGNANINSKVVQECGNSINKPPSGTSSSGTSPSGTSNKNSSSSWFGAEKNYIGLILICICICICLCLCLSLFTMMK